MQLLKSYLRKKKRKYISLRQAIIFEYIFMFGILVRPFPILENIEIINIDFWQIMYVLLPEITYYLLVFYSLQKVFELKSYLVNKNFFYLLITPNTILTLKLIISTKLNLNIIYKLLFKYEM